MRKKFKKFIPLVLATSAIVPIVTTSCTSSIEHKNYLVNYNNGLDASLALGITPAYYLSNIYKYGPNYAYAKSFIDPHLGKDTKIEDLKIYDGQDTDLKSLSRLQPYSLLVNEWERVDVAQYNNIVPNLLYTSMGDTINGRWNENDVEKDPSMTRFYKDIQTPITPGESDLIGSDVKRYATSDFGVSPEKALSMAATDIDRVYKTNGVFEKRATDIRNKFKQRITDWNNSKEFQKILNPTSSPTENQTPDQTYKNNVNLGIIYGGTNDNATTFSFLTPNAVPLIYSQLNGRGLGFNFPEPNDSKFKTYATYVTTYIKSASSDSNQLLEQFKNKFDYLIYVQSLENYSNGKTPDLQSFQTLLKTNIGETSVNDKRIYQTNYLDFYEAIWGIMGVNYILDTFENKIIPQFSETLTPSTGMDTNKFNLETFKTEVGKNKINFPTSNDVKLIYKDTDFSTFKDFNY